MEQDNQKVNDIHFFFRLVGIEFVEMYFKCKLFNLAPKAH